MENRFNEGYAKGLEKAFSIAKASKSILGCMEAISKEVSEHDERKNF